MFSQLPLYLSPADHSTSWNLVLSTLASPAKRASITYLKYHRCFIYSQAALTAPTPSILYPLPQRCALHSPLFYLFYNRPRSLTCFCFSCKIATRVSSHLTSLFHVTLYSPSTIAAIYHASTAENCQIAAHFLHPTAQRTCRAGTDSPKACRQHEEESGVRGRKG